MAYSRSKQEQETTITWDEVERVAHIYTCAPRTIRKLDKLVENCPDAYRCIWIDKDGLAKRYEVNSRFIRFGKPASEAVKLAAAKRAKESAERLANYREKDKEETA